MYWRDENEPKEILDEDAVKPEGWLEEEEALIPDPDAEKPDDWDDEMDGDWEAPLIGKWWGLLIDCHRNGLQWKT